MFIVLLSMSRILETYLVWNVFWCSYFRAFYKPKITWDEGSLKLWLYRSCIVHMRKIMQLEKECVYVVYILAYNICMRIFYLHTFFLIECALFCAYAFCIIGKVRTSEMIDHMWHLFRVRTYISYFHQCGIKNIGTSLGYSTNIPFN